jgi:predicted dehydrogenase
VLSSSNAPLRIGVLGAARVATYAMCEPARRSAQVRVVALAARDPERARRFAAEHGIDRVEEDYDALVEAPDVDAVYVALPAALHCAWTLRALEAGKHVLCEKPFASNAAEAEQMVASASAKNLVLVEAFHWRYHPLAARLLEIAASDEIGAIRGVDGGFTAGIPEHDIRYDLALGGGALMDLGCYPLHWARHLTASEPTVVRAEAVVGPPGVDVTLDADLAFPGEIHCHLHTSMTPTSPRRTWLRVRGGRGELFVDNPLHPHIGHQVEVRTGGTQRTERVAGETTYDHQLAAFAAAVAGGAPAPTGGADAVANMRAIDAIYRAAGLSPRG